MNLLITESNKVPKGYNVRFEIRSKTITLKGECMIPNPDLKGQDAYSELLKVFKDEMGFDMEALNRRG